MLLSGAALDLAKRHAKEERSPSLTTRSNLNGPIATATGLFLFPNLCAIRDEIAGAAALFLCAAQRDCSEWIDEVKNEVKNIVAPRKRGATVCGHTRHSGLKEIRDFAR